MKKSYLKIFFPALLAILLFILTIFFVIIPRYEQNVMNGKREMIQELTNTAISILSKYENDEQEGKLTREEAQSTAISRLQYLRYGEDNKDYFWITDTVPVMVMHPFRKDLNGKDLNTLADPHGKLLFVEMVKTVQAHDHGFVDYMWQSKDDSLHIVPKLSYVRIFKPWNWVVGTGVYIEDVKKEISGITKRLFQISIGISVLVSALLFYVFLQGVRIERRKNKAEEELKKSKEKYLTLVEAATDGLLMIADGKITFANNIFSKMTGYTLADLHHFPFIKMIGKNNNSDIVTILSQNTIKDGKYELGLIKKDGTLFEVLLTASTTLFLGKTVNILITKDITTDGDISFTNVDYQKLISTLRVGFFKADLNAKGSFLFADHTTIRILGFDNYEEVANQKLINLITDSGERKEIIRELQKEGVVKNKVVSIVNRRQQRQIVSVSLVSLPDERTEGFICDGIIEDISEREREKAATGSLIAGLLSGELLYETPVHKYAFTPVLMEADNTIGTAITKLEKSKAGCLVLTKGGHDIIGIITGSDVQRRVIELKLNFDNPAYMIMTSPVMFVTDFVPVREAISVCREKQISHLLLKNSNDQVTGVFHFYEFMKSSYKNGGYGKESIEKAIHVEELREAYQRLQVMVAAFVENGLPVNFVTGITTDFSDAIIRKLITFATDELGPAPAGFAFICLGSEGRKEETLLTDQDNAIIYEDVPKEMEQEVASYFARLSKIVCTNLNTIGYSFCKGNIMAMNQQWCKPGSVWLDYFKKWISLPEPHNLLEATIFFDFRFVYGEESLVSFLRERISSLVKENPLFLYHMANNTVQLKSIHLPSGSIHSDKNSGSVELKSALVPIVMFARTYSLQNNIWLTNTADRLTALNEMGFITNELYNELMFAYRFLSGLRLKNQAFQLQEKEKMTNHMDYKNISSTEFYILKKIITDIHVLQSKIKNDFRISV